MQSLFQVVYFTAVFPYVVLLILFFNGIFLSNAGEGIYFYIVPDFSRLLDAGVGDNANHLNKPDHFLLGKCCTYYYVYLHVFFFLHHTGLEGRGRPDFLLDVHRWGRTGHPLQLQPFP